MARKRVVSQPGGRVHVVMVPGFAGFDALGQLQYYAGVTPLFRRWKHTLSRQWDVVLHYFDNFPTAAVATRAARLKVHLAKRIARGEFQPGDRVALIGHSTGGLDVRQLLRGLADSPGDEILVDGGQGTAYAVPSSEVLGFVHRVVFLSVPHWGTNIADWVRAHAVLRTTVVADLRATVAASHLPFAAPLRDGLAQGALHLADADLLRAMRDALAELDPAEDEGGPTRIAEAHEARGELEVWLDHMLWDFSAIDDLAPERLKDDVNAPARAVSPARAEEPTGWARAAGHPIGTRSYATLGSCPFAFAGPEIPRWELLQPETYPKCRGTTADAVYCACYRACAGGPFQRTVPAEAFRFLTPSHQQTIEAWRGGGALERWENDGIVNTASMYWQDERETFLVPADHMDIVGHFRTVPALPGTGRACQAYDLLGSSSRFDPTRFEEVWNDVFTFCGSE